MEPILYPEHPVLLVDDESEILTSYSLSLRSGGIKNILSCQDSREVMPLLADREIDVVVLDLMMPHLSGEELLPAITRDFPDIPVIVITGNNEVDVAVRCMKAGAFDFMVKPVEKTRFVSGVKRALEIRELQNENRILKQRILSAKIEHPEAFAEIISKNTKMLSVFQYVESIAESRQPVLITGETGVGKELMARSIHRLSRSNGSLVSINVAGIDDNAFSDTLFGHAKGAFTGATQPRKGLVEKASGGTLLLDEIGDLKLESQIRLLRLLQEKEYYPLGSDLKRTTDSRIVVTTNQDLQKLQETGEFRKDLFYRLHTHHICIPPLRERLDDLPMLVKHFLAAASESLGKKPPSLPDSLLPLLSGYHFPGNIRELQTMIYDAVSATRSEMLSLNRFKAHLGQEQSAFIAGPIRACETFSACYDDVKPLPTLEEANLILMAEAMKRTNNNKSEAARLIGISRQRLARHLEISAQ